MYLCQETPQAHKGERDREEAASVKSNHPHLCSLPCPWSCTCPCTSPWYPPLSRHRPYPRLQPCPGEYWYDMRILVTMTAHCVFWSIWDNIVSEEDLRQYCRWGRQTCYREIMPSVFIVVRIPNPLALLFKSNTLPLSANLLQEWGQNCKYEKVARMKTMKGKFMLENKRNMQVLLHKI